jgi:hypothetical protein
MNERYEMLLAALRQEIKMDGARPAKIDAAATAMLATGDARIASDLLSLLSDQAAYDEGMFTLIHTAESFDDTTYVRSLLSVFPELVNSSPRWASIVLMRVLNSDATRREAVDQLRKASEPIKQSVKIMCERINEVRPQFLSKTAPVLIAAT